MEYKGYILTRLNDGAVVWSDGGGWMDCSFDNYNTAKHFIDLKDKFGNRFYDVISDMQKIAIEINDGLVSIEIVNKLN